MCYGKKWIGSMGWGKVRLKVDGTPVTGTIALKIT